MNWNVIATHGLHLSRSIPQWLICEELSPRQTFQNLLGHTYVWTYTRMKPIPLVTNGSTLNIGAHHRWMIPPTKQENSHSMAQKVSGKQVLVRMSGSGKTTTTGMPNLKLNSWTDSSNHIGMQMYLYMYLIRVTLALKISTPN